MKREMLVAAALSTLVAAARAQDMLPVPGPTTPVTPQTVYANPPLRGTYQSRALDVVYNNIRPINDAGPGDVFPTACNQVLEDVSFAGGPWGPAYTGPRVITGCTFGVVAVNTPVDPVTERVFLVFWDPADVTFEGFAGTGTNMIHPGASPRGAYIFSVGPIIDGQISVTGLNVPLAPGAVGVVVQVGWLNADAGVPSDWSDLQGHLDEPCPSNSSRGLSFGTTSQELIGGNPATIGATLPGYGRDTLTGVVCSNGPTCTHAGMFFGSPGPSFGSTCNEYRQLQYNLGSPAMQYGLRLRLQGEVTPPPPVCDPDVNQDGARDQGDVDYLINVIAGGDNPTGIDPDFNQDGAGDQGDIDALVNVVAGGQCP